MRWPLFLRQSPPCDDCPKLRPKRTVSLEMSLDEAAQVLAARKRLELESDWNELGLSIAEIDVTVGGLRLFVYFGKVGDHWIGLSQFGNRIPEGLR